MNKSEFQISLDHQEEQLRLFRYQNSRELPRPKTKKIDVAIAISIFILLLTVCIALNCIVEVPLLYEIFVSILVYALLMEFSLRYIGIKLVECYQHYATEETRRKCMCIPSCSEYAILCLKKFELIYALIKIRKRLFITCKGNDYIIDSP